MRLWLSRQRDGRYMLTLYQPIIARVHGTDQWDLYVVAGDPVGYRGMCPEITEKLFGVSLELLDSVQVELTGKVVS